MSLKDAIREAADARNKLEQGNTENLQGVLQQSSETAKPVRNKAVNTANGRSSGKAGNQAVNTASSKAVKSSANSKVEVKPVVPEEVKEAPEVETAALTIRVPLDSRIHWLVSAKKQKTTLTAAITEALNERFGPAPIED